MSAEKVREIKQISMLEHAKRKSMWTGGEDKQTIKLKVYHESTESFELEALTFIPALYKIINEVLENSIDQWTNYPEKVKNIRISFDKTGLITIHNDGTGIAVTDVKTVHGVKMHSVQMIASEFLSGDNLDNDEARITGGTNGAGLKLTNAFSDYLKVETWDRKNKIFYEQEFRDRLEVIEKPKLSDKPPSDFTGTRISFIPCFKHYGIDIRKEYPTYKTLIKTRACQTAAFVGANVFFNEKQIKVDFEDLAKMLTPDPLFFKLGSWDVAIGPSSGKFQHMSIINGINVYNGGTHVNHIRDQIVEFATKEADKLFKKMGTDQKTKNHVAHNLYIVIKGYIPNPSFPAQIKDKITTSADKYKEHTFDKKQLKKIWTHMEKYITSEIMDKVKDKKTRVTKADLLWIPKFEDAVYADSAKKHLTTLILCEGDSAKKLIIKGFASKAMPLPREYYGIFLTGGVPMNARNESTKSGDIIIRSKKLRDNERLQSLVKVLRLDFGVNYESDKEFAKLRYGSVVVAVDQDEDGKGNIFGLLINFFIRFWPNLIKRGFLQRLNTPIIRAVTPKKEHLDFFSIPQFEHWFENVKKTESNSYVKRIKTEYLKGLGSHEDLGVKDLFSKYNELLVKMILDEDAERTTEVYYGKDTEARKKALSTPVDIELKDVNNVTVSDQLNIDTKSYQRYNNLRKLPHVIDGLIPVRRKPLFAARKIFGKTNNPIKVPALTSKTVEMTDYPHGESSMEDSIIGKAQCFPGANNFPFFYAKGQFGTRQANGNDAAAARYLKTYRQKELCELLYPAADNDFLEYHFEEGKECEPVYYVPIIPMAIMESMSVPGNGWKIRVWARDFNQVLKIIRDAIADPGTLETAKEPDFWLNGIRPKIRKLKNSKGKTQIYSIGRYKYDPETRVLTITELPHEICAQQITEFNPKKKEEKKGKKKSEDEEVTKKTKRSLFKADRIKYIEDIRDHTTDDEVGIVITLKEGAFEEIETKYGNERFNSIIHWLNLWTTMDSHMNMMTADKEVKHFDTAMDIIREWFPIRKRIYKKRIGRMIILLQLRIRKLENEIRFSKHYREYKMHDLEEEQAIKILTDANYDRFYDKLFKSNKEIPVKDLEKTILNGPDSTYDYLLGKSIKSLILTKNCKFRETELARLRIELEELLKDNDPKFPGKLAWLRELEMLEKLTEEGIRTRWGTKEKMNTKFLKNFLASDSADVGDEAD